MLSGPRIDEAKYDASYRVTGNFLDWVIKHKDAELLRHLNAAARTGQYDSSLWKERTGLTLPELELNGKRHSERFPEHFFETGLMNRNQSDIAYDYLREKLLTRELVARYASTLWTDRITNRHERNSGS